MRYNVKTRSGVLYRNVEVVDEGADLTDLKSILNRSRFVLISKAHGQVILNTHEIVALWPNNGQGRARREQGPERCRQHSCRQEDRGGTRRKQRED